SFERTAIDADTLDDRCREKQQQVASFGSDVQIQRVLSALDRGGVQFVEAAAENLSLSAGSETAEVDGLAIRRDLCAHTEFVSAVDHRNREAILRRGTLAQVQRA